MLIRPLSIALLALGLPAAQGRATFASFPQRLFQNPPGLVPVRPQPADEHLPTHLKFHSGLAGFVFRQVVARASRRLLDPTCERIFTDFRDAAGDSLTAGLVAAGQTPVQFMSQLWWVDASDGDACRDNGNMAAFTTPHGYVVYVCGTRFADMTYWLNGMQGEMIVIHEMLHALGLGENPPTSGQITARVTARCGGSTDPG